MGTNNQTASTFAEAEQPSERDEDQVIISEEDLATANCDEEIGGWILNTLQKIQPGTEITAGSMRVGFKSCILNTACCDAAAPRAPMPGALTNPRRSHHNSAR